MHAIARYDLGLSEAEFWRSTHRSLAALQDRFAAARRRDLYCAAVTASAIYNVHRAEGSPVVTPEEIIGEDARKPEPKRMTVEEMKVLFQQAAAGLGGVVSIT